MLSVVGTRYAKALLDIVMGSGADAHQALADLRGIVGMIETSAVLKNALLSPAVSPSRKRAVMGRLIEPMGVGEEGPQLRVRGDRPSARLHDFASIVEAFETLLDERLGFVRGGSFAARTSWTDAQRATLEAQLSRLAGKKAKTQVYNRSGADRRGGGARGLDGLRRQRAGAVGALAGETGEPVRLPEVKVTYGSDSGG